jgi:phosphatidylserine/phosphatidylglycerophosphate/cardiolipin synthase-like enzyme
MKLWKLIPLFAVACHTSSGPPGDASPKVANLKVVEIIGAEPMDATPDVLLDPSGAWSLHFSPNGGCEDAIIGFIGTAKSSVHILAYGFTEVPVANALIAKKAGGHGMDVEVVLDKSDKTAKGSMANILKNGNVPVWIDSKHAIAHNKVIIVDDVAFETGSYNFTDSAEKKNAENCLIEQDPTKAQVYEKNFQLHKAHSEPLPYSN